jgi:hypothetical protein
VFLLLGLQKTAAHGSRTKNIGISTRSSFLQTPISACVASQENRRYLVVVSFEAWVIKITCKTTGWCYLWEAVNVELYATTTRYEVLVLTTNITKIQREIPSVIMTMITYLSCEQRELGLLKVDIHHFLAKLVFLMDAESVAIFYPWNNILVAILLDVLQESK